MGKLDNILITGANGFLGSHILYHLIDEGFSPVIILRPNSDLWRISDVIDQCKVFYVNEGKNDFSELFGKSDIDAIIHCANNYGKNGLASELLETNLVFPLQLIESGLKSGLKLFVNTDSFFSKKGYNQSYLNNYTHSKRILESFLIEVSKDVKVVNLRIEHVFGENDSDEKFVSSIFKKMMQKDKEILLTEGTQKRDLIYVKDVASAFIQVLKKHELIPQYKEFEVGQGSSISIREFVESVAKTLNSQTVLKFGALAGRAGEIEDSFADNKELKALGWVPEYALEESIKNIFIKEQERFI